MTRRSLFAAFFTFLWIASASPRSRDLTLLERIEAQRAIDRIYYQHQVGATEPFDQAVPTSVLDRKVRTYLKQSAALETFWRTPIDAKALQAEWKRIARESRFPDRLKEVYDALGSDPILIQECFVRPVLADRLARNFFASDARVQGLPRKEADRLRSLLLSHDLDPKQDHPNRRLMEIVVSDERPPEDGPPNRISLSHEEFERLRDSLPAQIGEVGNLKESHEAYAFSVLLGMNPNRLTLATYSVEKVGWDTWWPKVEGTFHEGEVIQAAEASPAPVPVEERRNAARQFIPALDTPSPNTGCVPADSWTRGMEEDFPDFRSGHTAVWTGTEMIIWGGYTEGLATTNALRGNRYDPLTDTWRMISPLGAPSPRSWHTAIWTGNRMVVWGGGSNTLGSAVVASGGRYDPVSDTWSSVSTVGAPSARAAHTAVWTGSRMLVWGGMSGSTNLAEGGRYDPATDTWSGMAASGLTPRHYHSSTWIGTRMLVWGGASDNSGMTVLGDGALYDPVADAWTPMTSTVNKPTSRRRHTAVWTGTRLILFGGDGGSLFLTYSDGRLYDPATDTWTTIPSFSPGRSNHRAVWTGSKMMTWGGEDANAAPLNSGGLFDPVAVSWQSTSLSGAPSPRQGHTMIWTGSRVIVWGGAQTHYETNVRLNSGRYDPQTDTWTPVDIGPEGPLPRYTYGEVWTGSHLIVWGGTDAFIDPSSSVGGFLNSGSRYDPITDSWNPTFTVNAPAARTRLTIAWAGNRMVVWGGYAVLFPGQGRQLTNTGGRYDPIADSWQSTTTVLAPPPAANAHGIGIGDRVFIAGWPNFDTVLYNPTTDTWFAASTSQQPSPRASFSMIWTGTDVVIWGGSSLVGGDPYLNDGGRYNVAGDSWSPLPTSQAPSARRYHTAVWTGSEMLVWGGRDAANALTNDGGRYDPAANQWAPLAGSNPPSARSSHVAVWTGSEMIVWGGSTDANEGSDTNTGGRYNPATQQWVPTSLIGAPLTAHFGEPVPPVPTWQAFWSGQYMLLWGGTGPNFGGVYAPAQVDEDGDGDGFTACTGDCDDTNPAVHPGALEVCNGIDDDCNNLIDDVDQDGDGYTLCVDDCNDTNPAVHPFAPEVCNGIDDDCDGTIDEGFDQDGDGHSACAGDCNDADPGAWSLPAEVSNLGLTGALPTSVSWNSQAASAGIATAYALSSGLIASTAGIDFATSNCLGSTGTGTSYQDSRPNPTLGWTTWYLARASNSCGVGSYGAGSNGQDRILPSCP